MSNEVQLDDNREDRVGFPDAIYCGQRSHFQIETTLNLAETNHRRLLLTVLSESKVKALSKHHRRQLDYCAVSKTAFFGPNVVLSKVKNVAIVSAGSSDLPVVREAERVLNYAGEQCTVILDVGVDAVWRLTDTIAEIQRYPIVIAVAGNDAALASVLGGIVSSLLIAVPTSVGYGAAKNGQTALNSMLCSCASGVLVCNIDNGQSADQNVDLTLTSIVREEINNIMISVKPKQSGLLSNRDIIKDVESVKQPNKYITHSQQIAKFQIRGTIFRRNSS